MNVPKSHRTLKKLDDSFNDAVKCAIIAKNTRKLYNLQIFLIYDAILPTLTQRYISAYIWCNIYVHECYNSFDYDQ